MQRNTPQWIDDDRPVACQAPVTRESETTPPTAEPSEVTPESLESEPATVCAGLDSTAQGERAQIKHVPTASERLIDANPAVNHQQHKRITANTRNAHTRLKMYCRRSVPKRQQ